VPSVLPTSSAPKSTLHISLCALGIDVSLFPYSWFSCTCKDERNWQWFYGAKTAHRLFQQSAAVLAPIRLKQIDFTAFSLLAKGERGAVSVGMP
jgi:hypothetical protein